VFLGEVTEVMNIAIVRRPLMMKWLNSCLTMELHYWINSCAIAN